MKCKTRLLRFWLVNSCGTTCSSNLFCVTVLYGIQSCHCTFVLDRSCIVWAIVNSDALATAHAKWCIVWVGLPAPLLLLCTGLSTAIALIPALIFLILSYHIFLIHRSRVSTEPWKRLSRWLFAFATNWTQTTGTAPLRRAGLSYRPQKCDCAIQLRNVWGSFQVSISSQDHELCPACPCMCANV